MYQKLLPHLFYPNIFAIDFEALWDQGIRGLIFDLDNTICSYSTPKPDEKTMCFFQNLRQKGFQVWLVSNNNRQRVELFNEELGLQILPQARKPLLGALRRAVKQMDLPLEKIALIGDQIYTDMLGGNRLGVFTVLVEPVEEKENWFFKLKRKMEIPVIRHFQQYGRGGRKP